jgi:homoserine kinase
MAKRLHLRIPGSTANLGPGFDTLGLALGIYTDITFELLDKPDPAIPLFELQGDIAQQLPADRSNLIYETIASLWSDRKDLLDCLRFKVSTQIPLVRGLGSSSTAVLGAVWAARVLCGQTADKAEILSTAAAIEGHPDNLAASLYGSLAISKQSTPKVMVQTMPWPTKWSILVVVPPYPLSTNEARAVLPSSVSLADAVSNVQQAALLVAAVANENDQALMEALHDRLHEPYRESLVPELPKLRQELELLPALGCVLSGAGPSILVVVNEHHKPEVSQGLRSWAKAQQPAPQILELEVDQQGVKEFYAG